MFPIFHPPIQAHRPDACATGKRGRETKLPSRYLRHPVSLRRLGSAVTRGVTDIPFVLGNAFAAAEAEQASEREDRCKGAFGWRRPRFPLPPSLCVSRMGIKQRRSRSGGFALFHERVIARLPCLALPCFRGME